jgi:hypothetical protein
VREVRRTVKALLIVMFLFALTAGLHALELYLRRAVVLQSARPALRDLVYALPFDVSRPTLLPASAVRQALLPGAGGPVIVSGGRVALVPAALAGPKEAIFYRDLLEYVDARDSDRSSRIELEIIDTPAAGDYDPGLKRYFELRELGDVTEVAYPTLSGRPRSFRMRILRIGDDAPGAPPAAGPAAVAAAGAVGLDAAAQADNRRELALRGGERIRIRFVRGSVAVTLPGRALRSGYPGEVVPVRPFDSEQSYDALVTGKREVVVDLP